MPQMPQECLGKDKNRMAKRHSTKKRNYRRATLAAIQSGELRLPPGRVTVLSVYHDTWCNIFKRGRCNCALDIIQARPDQCG